MSSEANYEYWKTTAEAVLEAQSQDNWHDNVDRWRLFLHYCKPETVLQLLSDLAAAREAQRTAEEQIRLDDEALRQTEKQRDLYKDVLGFYAAENHYNEEGAIGTAKYSSPPMEPTEYDFEPDYGHFARKALGLEPTMEQLASVRASAIEEASDAEEH